MDNAQNNNARYVDNFGNNNKTSVKTTNPPGGKSSFSLGWTEPEAQQAPKKNYNNDQSNNNYNQPMNDYNQPKNNYNQQQQQQPQQQQQQQGTNNGLKTGVRVK